MKEVKAFIKSASLIELEKAQALLGAAIAKHTEQQQAKQDVLDLLKEKGLTLEDLQDIVGDKRTKVLPKYRIEHEGKIVEWTGRGKRPKAFQDVDLTKHLA
ncbi:histone family protein nucleoid-structuring protein H-NS [Pseudoalteromonas porphyrae]|uniref:Histone family protein nucleoid-structuring protein H-NS n=2 Tax=Pseudoalteromonas TaxID=53246 RepID=A0A0N0LZT2_9GAMM|nr:MULTISPECIES: H-NS family nucleoid-associated regulatory protein [Pseudoalteromonas]KPH63261.1 histone family protein nucleoid-structuring protein H-NS [Pseudoalteromonas porphyrae]KPH94207.1 histone family protein nucleoid-structuring protein H-NS [Pseudoalteromonas porphyrae]NMR25275.1 H-NS histone family protein [Pseudoalteromonas sp. NEC-BIFX-2020_015]NNG42858.1 H-NS histone family protein [Pseudoalteromonas sp. NEC-BIFX-2020_002]